MARKSRKIPVEIKECNVVSDELVVNRDKFKAGLYTRLSVEDDGVIERGTIENQMKLLEGYIDNFKNIVCVRKYKDVDMTGTNFNRDGFKEMMRDIRNNVINCVIVKDLSRFGRNYVETSNYIERVFPFFDVRFIAINDDIDTFNKDMDMMLPLKNIINEMYSKDISEKIKSSFRARVSKGEYIQPSIAYGYKKDIDNKNKIVIDEVVSDNVEMIFKMFVNGKTYSQIARELNEMNIVPPSVYKLMIRGVADNDMGKIWQDKTVKAILENRVYVGDMLYGTSYRSKFDYKKGMKPKEEWIVIENTHEEIVSREVYELAQERIAKIKDEYDKRNKNNKPNSTDNMFSGKIFCADCGKRLIISKPFETRSFACRGYVRKDRGYKCTRHTIMYVDVVKIVYAVIRGHIKSCLDGMEVVEQLNEYWKKNNMLDIFSKEISKLKREQHQVMNDKVELFEDYRQGLIDGEQYIAFSNEYNIKSKIIDEKLEGLKVKRERVFREYKVDANWQEIVHKYKNKRKLTKEMVNAFVDKIIVSEGGKCQINLKYDDCFRSLQENIKERRGEF